MIATDNISQWILGFLLILSSMGVIITKKPVHSSLFFLFALLMLAAIYLQLSAHFIAVMQVLIYAGAILVIFMFVIVLFQDAYLKIAAIQAQSWFPFLFFAGSVMLLTFVFVGKQFLGLSHLHEGLPEGFGSVEYLGRALYLDFFFPFEAVVLIFLVAVVGALYIAKKVE